MAKKLYEPPRILETQTLTSRAVTCIHSDDICRQQGGPNES